MEITNREFLEKTEEQKQTALMETSMRLVEIFDNLDDGRLDPEMVAEYGSLELLQLFTKMAYKFEDMYCGTKEYDDDFIGLTDWYFTHELLDVFNRKETYRLRSFDGIILYESDNAKDCKDELVKKIGDIMEFYDYDCNVTVDISKENVGDAFISSTNGKTVGFKLTKERI